MSQRPPKTRRETAPPFVPAEIRQDIVDAAAELFSERGYHAASMQDIALAAGMRKASLYHHVRTKEDLLFAIHERLIDGLISRTVEVLSTAHEPPEKLAEILRIAMDLVANHNKEVKVFLHEVDVLTDERWEAIVSKRDIYESMVSGVIREGIKRGAFVDVNVGIATRGILAMANWGYTWFRPNGPMSANEIADIFASLVLRGLETRGA